METAKNTDLPDLLAHLGYQVRQVGRFHTTKEMDSLRIKDRRIWERYSRDGGMMEHIDMMLEETDDPREKGIIRRFKKELERA